MKWKKFYSIKDKFSKKWKINFCFETCANKQNHTRVSWKYPKQFQDKDQEYIAVIALIQILDAAILDENSFKYSSQYRLVACLKDIINEWDVKHKQKNEHE